MPRTGAGWGGRSARSPGRDRLEHLLDARELLADLAALLAARDLDRVEVDPVVERDPAYAAIAQELLDRALTSTVVRGGTGRARRRDVRRQILQHVARRL